MPDLRSELKRVGAAPKRDRSADQGADPAFPTLYAVVDQRNTMMVLVVADDGALACAMAAAEGFAWAVDQRVRARVKRLWRGVREDRGIIDVFELSGRGHGNSHNAVTDYIGGTMLPPENQS